MILIMLRDVGSVEKSPTYSLYYNCIVFNSNNTNTIFIWETFDNVSFITQNETHDTIIYTKSATGR